MPIGAALVLGGLLAAQGVASWFRIRRGGDAGSTLWHMTLTGCVAARLVFLLRHHDLYGGDVVSMLNIRDGGFDGPAGLLAGCVAGAWLTRKQAALRRPLLVSTLAGCAVWFGGTLLDQGLASGGAPLPALDVRRLDGTTVSLQSFAGRPVVVNLWATWCPPCRREMPALQAAQQASPGVAFVFVNQGETPAAVGRYLSEHGLRIENVVLDPGSRVTARTGATGYPTTLFYDAAGRLRERHLGELSQATVRATIARLDGGR